MLDALPAKSMTPVKHFPVSDLRRDVPNILTVAVAVILPFLFWNQAYDYGVREFSKPQDLLGAALANYGGYPFAESMTSVAFLGLVALQMVAVRVYDAFRKKTQGEGSEPIAASQVQISKKEDVNYYFGLNALTLHLPRALLATSVLTMIAAIPWIHVALDNGLRFYYLDYNHPMKSEEAGENAAAYWGFVASRAIPIMLFAAASLLPVIKNLRYAKTRSTDLAETTPQRLFRNTWDNMFVDQTAKVEVVAAPSVF